MNATQYVKALKNTRGNVLKYPKRFNAPGKFVKRLSASLNSATQTPRQSNHRAKAFRKG